MSLLVWVSNESVQRELLTLAVAVQDYTSPRPIHQINITPPCPCFRYSFEGVLQAVYGGDRDPLACKEPTVRGGCVFVEGSDVLKTLDVKDAKFYVDFIVLCVFFVVLRLGCYIVLRWRVKVH